MLDRLLIILLLILPSILPLGNGIIDISCTSIAILFLIKLSLAKSIHPIKERWFGLFLLLWILMVFQSFFIIETWKSFQAAITFVRFPLFALAIASIIKEHPSIKPKLFLIISLILMMLSINSLFQMFNGQDLFSNNIIKYNEFFRLTTPTGKLRVGYICTFFTIPLLGYLFDLMISKTTSKQVLFTIAFSILLGLTIIFLSGERMPLAITLLTLSFCLIKVKEYHKQSLIGFIIILVFFASCLSLSPQLQYRIFKVSYLQINYFNEDAYGKIYQASWNIFKQNPIFGIGSNNFSEQYSNYAANTKIKSLSNAYHPHNWYLQILVENGLIGFILFIITVGALCSKLLKFRGQYYTYFASILVTVKLLPIVSSSNIYAAWSSFPFWFIIGLALSSIKFDKNCLG